MNDEDNSTKVAYIAMIAFAVVFALLFTWSNMFLCSGSAPCGTTSPFPCRRANPVSGNLLK